MTHGKQIEKGTFSIIKNGEVSRVFSFQFNPTQRSVGHAANYSMSTPPGSHLPTAAFKNIDGPQWGLTLLLDATYSYKSELEGTRAQKAFLELLVQPDADQYLNDLNAFTAPPEVRYSMGGDSFRVLVTRCDFRDVRFNAKGFETRTYVDLDMVMYMADESLLVARVQKLQRLARLVTSETVTVNTGR